MKKLANNWADILAGRKTHPITPIVGGWSKWPDIDQLKAINERLEESHEGPRYHGGRGQDPGAHVPGFPASDRVYRP